MRIAVAGGGGLGYLIAKALSEAPSALNVVVLSRYARTEYAPLEIQVMPVDYNDLDSLVFALQGVNLVISVVGGREQLNLINSAAASGVQMFVPSEFEGSISKRPRNDPLDTGSYAHRARSLLRKLSQSSQMQYTIFSCGVFMERFHPSGLGSLNIGHSCDLAEAGSYLLNLNLASAEIVEKDSGGHTVRICMTSVYDVAQFVAAAVELGPGNWPREWTMRGDRMSLRDIVGTSSKYLNTAFEIQYRQFREMEPWIEHYTQQGATEAAATYQRLLATANGRYEFGTASLNEAIRNDPNVEDVRATSFRHWIANMYPAQAS
ncbi:hypothetical protein B0J13DRAFT_621316 [Dactylonectria estremocensis]|uniref:NmrA-like domain-containing protein n=1 Tax=Dactylonectria estremocensis TaxID=1079267 RepID=A0A9P9F088_9HYPO|nr:hypothetical protein B0J13DRAFT_621316 [Dactylonectria estremocensis]